MLANFQKFNLLKLSFKFFCSFSLQVPVFLFDPIEKPASGEGGVGVDYTTPPASLCQGGKVRGGNYFDGL